MQGEWQCYRGSFCLSEVPLGLCGWGIPSNTVSILTERPSLSLSSNVAEFCRFYYLGLKTGEKYSHTFNKDSEHILVVTKTMATMEK